MRTALELFCSGGLAILAMLALRAGFTRAEMSDCVTYRLTFPTGLDAEAVTRLLVGVCGLLPPWWRRLVVRPVVTFEIRGSSSGIEHLLVVSTSHAPAVEAALSAHVPSVRWQPIETGERSELVIGAEYRTSSDRRPLRSDPVAVSHGLLLSLQPLRHEEVIVVQWLLTPAGPVRPARMASKQDQRRLVPDAQLLDNAEAVTALRSKQSQPMLLAVGRIAAQTSSVERARAILRRAEAPLHGTRAPGVHLSRRLISARSAALRTARRSVPITIWPAVLNAEEATSLIGWPLEAVSLPGVTLGGCRLLPVSNAVPTRGTVLGVSTFPGSAGRPVALDLQARLRHTYVAGPTGSGKSVLLTRIVLSDIEAGHAVVVLDPKGDVIEAVAERCDESRLDQVLVLDAADDQRPLGYNPLAATEDTRELVVEQVLGVMRSIWRASWGPRSDEIVRACLLTLVGQPGMTLAEIPALLTDPTFRTRVLARVHDPFGVEGFWATFQSWGAAERTAATAPVLNKVRAFTMRPRLRGLLGQSEGVVDFGRIIRDRQILLVNLAAGRLGTEAAYLLGALLFAGLWNAVSARAGSPTSERSPVMATLDEFQHLVALPTPAETVLAEARSYGLGIVLAHQELGQLDTSLERAALANARSKVIFQTSRHDAGVFAKELGGGLTPEDLMGLPPYEAVASCFAGGSTRPPATIATLALPPAVRAASEVFELSRDRWGTPRQEVDAAIAERQRGGRRGGEAIGRGRRDGR
jgi:hypothetical protein